MHFLYSLLFLFLTMIMVMGYFTLTTYIVISVPALIWRSNHPVDKTSTEKPNKKKLGFHKKILLFHAIITLTFCSFVYIHQRIEWMGEDNAHLYAKEYYVAGQVVNGLRVILNTYLHPDNLIVRPANMLQQWIYDVGTSYLPKDDGEIGIWMHTWFIYPYTKKNLKPYGTKNDKLSPGMIALLDKMWFAIETVATKPIADEKMKVQHYYRNFPAMLFDYCIDEGYYAGKHLGSLKFLKNDPVQIDRSKKIVKWIYDLKKKWSLNIATNEFVKQNPKVEAILSACLIIELHDIFFAEIASKQFSCDKPYVNHIIEAMNEFGAGVNGEIPAYKRMMDSKQAGTLYNIAIENVMSSFVMYALSEFCGKTLFLNKHQILNDKMFGSKMNSFKVNFKDELAFLKENSHD